MLVRRDNLRRLPDDTETEVRFLGSPEFDGQTQNTYLAIRLVCSELPKAICTKRDEVGNPVSGDVAANSFNPIYWLPREE